LCGGIFPNSTLELVHSRDEHASVGIAAVTLEHQDRESPFEEALATKRSR
jgi:hypothetical protein